MVHQIYEMNLRLMLELRTVAKSGNKLRRGAAANETVDFDSFSYHVYKL